ncbi:hypothetical protein [Paenibacillus sp. BAC0078]
MSTDPYLQPVVSNQSIVLFNSAAGTDAISYSNTVNTPVVGPVLSLLKSADKSSVSLGETLIYTLVTRNDGNAAALATLTDVLPAGVAFISNSVLRDGVPLPGASPSFGIPLGTIFPQTEVRIVFQVIVISLPPSLELSNEARATYSFATPEGREGQGEISSNNVRVSLIPYQLSLLLSASTLTTFVGDAVTYTLQLRNEGTRHLYGILADIPVPDGAVFIHGSVIAGGIYLPDADPEQGIQLGALKAGAAADISFRVRIASLPSTLDPALATHALVTYGAESSTETSKSNSVVISVVQSGISVSLKVDLYSAAPGDNLRYEFTIRNSGNLAVTAVLTDVIPAGTLFVWDSVNVNGTPRKDIRPGEGIQLGALTAGSTAIVNVLVAIPAAIDIAQTPAIQNQGNVQYTFTLPDGRNVRETARSNTATTLLLSPVISVEMTGEPSIIEHGDIVRFSIVVANSGNYPADVTIIQLLPQRCTLEPDIITISTVPAPDTSYSGAMLLGEMQPGQTVKLSYSVRINPAFMGLVLQGFSTALYLYTIDGRRYSGEVRSNSYKLIIEEISE